MAAAGADQDRRDPPGLPEGQEQHRSNVRNGGARRYCHEGCETPETDCEAAHGLDRNRDSCDEGTRKKVADTVVRALKYPSDLPPVFLTLIFLSFETPFRSAISFTPNTG